MREAFSLAIWVLAFWVSWSFFRHLEVPMRAWIDSPTARLGIAFALLMIVTLVVGGLVNYLIIQLVEAYRDVGYRSPDRDGFGAARGVLLVAALVLLAGLTPLPGEHWWAGSTLVGYFEELAFWLRDLCRRSLRNGFATRHRHLIGLRTSATCAELFGIVGNGPVNQSLYDALLVLQHRGQDAAGIMTCGNGRPAASAQG